MWQSKKIAGQLALYAELSAMSTAIGPMPEVIRLEESALTSAHRSPATIRRRKVFVTRAFTLSHDGRNVEFQLASESASSVKDPLRIAAPPAVIPYETAADLVSIWVHYPTSYAFFAYGQVQAKDMAFQARTSAISALDEHIDAFMVARGTHRAAIETAIDGIDRKSTEGQLVKDLPAELGKRLVAAANSDPGKSGFVGDIGAWIRDATVTRIVSRIYIEELDTKGDLVDIEVP
jgi:hypothetical protein